MLTAGGSGTGGGVEAVTSFGFALHFVLLGFLYVRVYQRYREEKG